MKHLILLMAQMFKQGLKASLLCIPIIFFRIFIISKPSPAIPGMNFIAI
jgi:hypothetical protein